VPVYASREEKLLTAEFAEKGRRELGEEQNRREQSQEKSKVRKRAKSGKEQSQEKSNNQKICSAFSAAFLSDLCG
jgi:hypothetical protein